jgi:mono/diheme cytochrome c family protein
VRAHRLLPHWILAAALISPLPALAGDAARGQEFAERVCADCHGVRAGQEVSPNIKAPPFAVVAASRLATAREIDAWLQTAHTDMPDLHVPAATRQDLIAYIASLAKAKQ